MSESIKVPTRALPALGAAIAVAVSWGVLQANTANASEERARIEQIAEEAVKKAQKNGQALAVTDQKVQAIVDSLSRQEKIQEQTNTQIQALVQALLNKS